MESGTLPLSHTLRSLLVSLFRREPLGDILTKLERFAEAVKAYEHALRMSPDSIGVYSSQAEALKKLGRYDQALAACNKGLKLQPKNFALLFTRAGVLKKLLRYEEANADYLSAQLIAPNPLGAAVCIIAKVDLRQVTEAKTRLQAGGKELSDDAIEAEPTGLWRTSPSSCEEGK